MHTGKSNKYTIALFIGGLMLFSLLLIALPMWAEAAPPADLPTRPTPTPKAPPPPTQSPRRPTMGYQLQGGFIQLKVTHGTPATWSLIQWQDQTGRWHDVQGWRGTLEDEGQQKTWWVPNGLYDLGPFRWVLYDAPKGNALAYSEPFTMPSYNGDWVLVEVNLSD